MHLRPLFACLALMTSPAAALSSYLVQPGDTLNSIARQYNIDVPRLQLMNGLENLTVQVGQELSVPSPSHTVKAGETLQSIARLTGLLPETLIELNALSNEALQVGQVLLLSDEPVAEVVLPALAPPRAAAQPPRPTPVQPAPILTQPAPVPRQAVKPTTVALPKPLQTPAQLPSRTVTTTPQPAPRRPPTATVIPAPVRPTVITHKAPTSKSRLQRGLFVPTVLPPASAAVIRTTNTNGRRPAQIYLPNVGFEHQTWNNCGPAALVAALKPYGIQATQHTWRQRLRPAGGFMHFGPAQQLLKQLGFAADVRRNGTIEQVKQQVAQGYPVIVLQFHSVPGATPHFRVVRGYNEAQGILIMSDSLSGPNVALTEHDFNVLWNTQGRQYLAVRQQG